VDYQRKVIKATREVQVPLDHLEATAPLDLLDPLAAAALVADMTMSVTELLSL
jgi:hypothetical protein